MLLVLYRGETNPATYFPGLRYYFEETPALLVLARKKSHLAQLFTVLCHLNTFVFVSALLVESYSFGEDVQGHQKHGGARWRNGCVQHRPEAGHTSVLLVTIKNTLVESNTLSQFRQSSDDKPTKSLTLF